MPTPARLMVDIHCHMIPGIDDGAAEMQEALQMARMAVNDGIGTVICTPHQLGHFQHNTGDLIRKATAQFQLALQQANIPLRVLPGGDVRIEQGMVQQVIDGTVMSLADRRRHVLLELPHDLYFPLEPILDQLKSAGLVGILSHPERNQGLLRQPNLLPALVDAGCLMQVTAGSVMGKMGSECQELAKSMLHQGLVHFIASDAHGTKTRRPLLNRAFADVAALTDEATAQDLFVRHPACVAIGKDVPAGRRTVDKPVQRSWFGFKKAS